MQGEGTDLRWLPIAGMLMLGLWACDSGDLPRDYRVLEVPGASLASPEARTRGRGLFLEHCAICHGERANGRGRRSNLSVKAADFTDPRWRGRMSPRRVFFSVREGVGGTPMPAWRFFTTDQVWDLVAYVLSVAELGPGT
jgi:mono/diheme cytochrome c family protein